MTPRTPSSPSQDFLASHRWELHPMAIPKPSRARSWSLFPTSHSRLCHRSFPEHITEVHRTFVPAIPLELEFPSRFFRLEKVIFQSHLPKPSLTCRLIGGGGLSSGFPQPSGTQGDETYFCGLRQSSALHTQCPAQGRCPRLDGNSCRGRGWLKLLLRLHHLSLSPANRTAQAAPAAPQTWGHVPQPHRGSGSAQPASQV